MVCNTFACCIIICAFLTDKYHCPVTYKVFNENSHIVAVCTTGNVYSYEVSRIYHGYCFFIFIIFIGN